MGLGSAWVQFYLMVQLLRVEFITLQSVSHRGGGGGSGWTSLTVFYGSLWWLGKTFPVNSCSCPGRQDPASLNPGRAKVVLGLVPEGRIFTTHSTWMSPRLPEGRIPLEAFFMCSCSHVLNQRNSMGKAEMFDGEKGNLI